MKLKKEKEELEKERINIQSEIESINKELKALNDKTVEKYYVFSEYNDATNQDCMNQLSVLKARENSLRKYERDINFIYDFQSKSVKPRVTRQMLRNFNSDCENIMSNIRTANIDLVRNRIRKSYETINYLYSDYYASITEEMLSLKLERATLLYTSELKKQQEKEPKSIVHHMESIMIL